MAEARYPTPQRPEGWQMVAGGRSPAQTSGIKSQDSSHLGEVPDLLDPRGSISNLFCEYADACKCQSRLKFYTADYTSIISLAIRSLPLVLVVVVVLVIAPIKPMFEPILRG